jgi:hypothetical protein
MNIHTAKYVAGGVLLVALGIGAGVWWGKQKEPPPGGVQECTMEGLVCPDGSVVGRTGPNCSFAACPQAAPSSTSKLATTSPKTADVWQVYSNQALGFSLRYPKGWSAYNSPEELFPGVSIQPPDPKSTTEGRYSDVPFTYLDVFLMDRTIESVRSQYTGRATAGNQNVIEDRTTIGGKTAYSFRLSTDDAASIRNFYVPLNGKVYAFKTERYQTPEVREMLASVAFK